MIVFYFRIIIHVPPKHQVWQTVDAPSIRDITLWLSGTTDKSNVSIGSREVQDNERRHCTVQLGYCNSDVTVCLLFYIMPIVQNGEINFPCKGYTYYMETFDRHTSYNQFG